MKRYAFALLVVVAASTMVLLSDEAASPLDGRWKATYTTAEDAIYTMEFADGRFHAVSGDAWYKGKLVINDSTEPPQIDFAIDDCECGFKGKTSTGIFRWDGEVIEIRAPTPGDPRPTGFDIKSSETMRLTRQGS